VSPDAAILAGLLLLAAALLAPPLPRRPRRAPRPLVSPQPLGPAVGPYERWEAERKGQALLRQLLTPPEYRTLHERGFLEVTSPTAAGRVYRIPRRRGLVAQIEEGRVATRLCVVPDRWLPDADIVLLHKLLIEADEAQYLRVANVVPPPGDARDPASAAGSTNGAAAGKSGMVRV
jgi:hypothetical protein